MRSLDEIRIAVNPSISADQLFSFYERNDVCEKGYGKEIVARVLDHSSLIVAAFDGDRLIGIARAMFDGLHAQIVEFCLELEYQGEDLVYDNGSLIECDRLGLGKRIGEVILGEIERTGAYFISTKAFENVEQQFYQSLGFRLNSGSLEYIIDKRPYVQADSEGGAE